MKRLLLGHLLATILLCDNSIAQAQQRSWTRDDTENYWAAIAEVSTRVSTMPRLKDAQAETGEGILEAFGAKYLPNTYARYQGAREKAKEREAIYKENFPHGRSSDITGGNLHYKIQKTLIKAVAEMDRRHDELCHYYLLHKSGIMTDAELAKVDTQNDSLMLLGAVDNIYYSSHRKVTCLSDVDRTFAGKYLPVILAGYDKLSHIHLDGTNSFSVIRSDAIKIDAVRGEILLEPLWQRLEDLADYINSLVNIIRGKKLLHAVEEVTSEQLAKIDMDKGAKIQNVAKNTLIRKYVHNYLAKHWEDDMMRELHKTAPTLALPFDMVWITGKRYAICKYEVTRALWQDVMKNQGFLQGKEIAEKNMRVSDWGNPAFLPIVGINRHACDWFVKRLNNRSEVKRTGLIYRLPTNAEWEHACRAGGAGEYCKMMDGTEITEGNLRRVANFSYQGSHSLNPIGKQEPNAFGLYDMFGNVSEWCQDIYTGDDFGRYFCRGGSYATLDFNCRWNTLQVREPTAEDDTIGFRLVAYRNESIVDKNQSEENENSSCR